MESFAVLMTSLMIATTSMSSRYDVAVTHSITIRARTRTAAQQQFTRLSRPYFFCPLIYKKRAKGQRPRTAHQSSVRARKKWSRGSIHLLSHENDCDRHVLGFCDFVQQVHHWRMVTFQPGSSRPQCKGT